VNERTNIHDIPFSDRFKGGKMYESLTDLADLINMEADAGDKTINQEDPSVTTNSNWNEASLIEAINHSFANVDRLTTDAKQYRIAAGKALIEASQHVPAGEWGKWCKANIRRSERDIRKVMKMAGAADPNAAAEDERKRNREDQARRREKLKRAESDRSPEPPTADASPVDAKDTRLVECDAEIAKLKAELARVKGDAVKWESEYNVIGAERFQLLMEVSTLRKDKEVLEKKLAEQQNELRFFNLYIDAEVEGPFTKEEWTILTKCLHPDGSPSAEMKTRAMQLLNVRKAFLTGKLSPSGRRKAA
jgi:Protein of unknown function (DUF3102)